MATALVIVVVAFASIAVGATLLLVPRRGAPRHPACGRCGYDVSMSIGTVTRCPECGSAFAQVGILPAGYHRRRRRWVAVALVVVGGILLPTSSSLVMYQRALAAQRVAARQAALAAMLVPSPPTQPVSPSETEPADTLPEERTPASR